jgi:hypothetical protein
MGTEGRGWVRGGGGLGEEVLGGGDRVGGGITGLKGSCICALMVRLAGAGPHEISHRCTHSFLTVDAKYWRKN